LDCQNISTMEMKLLQIVLLVAVFSGAQSVVSSEDIEAAKAQVLEWFNKVESSLDTGVQKLSTDFAARLDASSNDIRKKFEQHKEKFANSEYSAHLAKLQTTLAAKQVEISKDMEAKLAKAGAEVHQQMEETKKHLTNMHGESKEQFLQWFAEAQKKVEGGVQKLNNDFTVQLESTNADLKSKFDQHKANFAKSEYAGKLSELSDTLKVKHAEISKDVAKTIARVSEDVKAQMGEAKQHIQNIRAWLHEEM